MSELQPQLEFDPETVAPPAFIQEPRARFRMYDWYKQLDSIGGVQIDPSTGMSLILPVHDRLMKEYDDGLSEMYVFAMSIQTIVHGAGYPLNALYVMNTYLKEGSSIPQGVAMLQEHIRRLDLKGERPLYTRKTTPQHLDLLTAYMKAMELEITFINPPTPPQESYKGFRAGSVS